MSETAQTTETTLPHSLDIISECLPSFHQPEGSFDPNGEWEHRYQIWVALRGNFGKSHQVGALRIQRRLGADAQTRLLISQTTDYGGAAPGTNWVQAQLTCADDALCTPLSWRVTTRTLTREWQPVEGTYARLTGDFANGRVTLWRERARRIEVAARLTGSWSLFDAVQRLPFDAKPLDFDMLDDLELPKPGQRLAPGPVIETELGGKRTRLRSFEQIGRGILPYTYWLDEHHRLLMAVGGVRTFLWDPIARVPEDQP